MALELSLPGTQIYGKMSRSRAITGVATAITAFIGRALRGPVNEPVEIGSYAEFERRFGGLWLDSSLAYAVRDFYANGGSRAIIVRLYHAPVSLGSVVRSHAQLRVDGLTLRARSWQLGRLF